MLSYTNDPGLTPGDSLTVQLSYGTTTRTLKTYYDVEATGIYDLKVFDLTPYAGKTVTLRFTAKNNADGFYSGWLIDDVAVKYTTS
jgi:aminopeptidase S